MFKFLLLFAACGLWALCPDVNDSPESLQGNISVFPVSVVHDVPIALSMHSDSDTDTVEQNQLRSSTKILYRGLYRGAVRCAWITVFVVGSAVTMFLGSVGTYRVLMS